MANKYMAQAEMDFAGETRLLQFDNNGIVELEQLLGMNFTVIAKELEAGQVRWQFVRDALFVTMRENWGKKVRLTPSFVGQHMDPGKLGDYMTKLGEIMQDFMPQNLPDEGGEEQEEGAPGGDPTPTE